MEEIKLALSIASAIVAIVAVLLGRRQFALARQQFDLARKVLEQNHDYSRRQYAAQLIGQWDEKTLASRQAIMSIWSECFNQNVRIPWSQIESLRQKQIAALKDAPNSASPTLVVTDHMAKVLNFLELVATSALNGVADDDILRQSFKVTTNRWYLMFADYRDQMKTLRGFDAWEPLNRLHRRWHPEDADKDKTGAT
jgi:hypothetical protein